MPEDNPKDPENAEDLHSASAPLPDEVKGEAAPTVPADPEPAPMPAPQVIIARPEPIQDDEIGRLIRRTSRRAFLTAGVAALAGLGAWRWLVTRRQEDGLLWPLRRVLEVNEEFARDYFGNSHLSKTYPEYLATEPKVNGEEGLDGDFDPDTWRLMVVAAPDIAGSDSDNDPKSTGTTSGPRPDTTPGSESEQGDDDDDDDSSDSGSDTDSSNASDSDSTTDDGDQEESLSLTLDDIKKLPRSEVVTELRCIEGWSVIVKWGGARFSDFAQKYLPSTTGSQSSAAPVKPLDMARYVSLETPGGGYYVGLDMASAMHPQTLLCYEMNGKPLTVEHGAPLRLVIPVKYGIKSIKRIGTIRFTNRRPADFWAEQGYDWYAGL
ncbi:MAG TPA: molybdopterin-dependent oxidoreductase [Blastocatellia bacterium]|nr:molybdopterin-dependent oxidoreductase [Blastocatellia bacterium]